MAVVAIILVIMMVSSLALAAVYADSTESVTASSSSSQETVSSESATEAVESSSASESVTSSSGSSDSTSENNAGVYIEDIDVTNMTEEEIQSAVDSKMSDLSDDTIVLYAGDRSVRVTAGSLGLSYSNTDIAEEAYSIGRKGNIYKRFLADYHLSTEGSIILSLKLTASESDVRSTLEQYLSNLNCEPKSNGLVLNDDYTFTLEEGSDGVSVNVDASVEKIMDYISNEWHGGTGGVTLDAEITPYEDTSDELSQVTDLLGTATTTYDTTDEDHATNIELAASHIDGSVVYPGEEFSTDDAIGPTTEANGFRPGASYSGSLVVETFGGGICQVSTTLYDAVLEAELEVTERHNHSHKIGYVEPGFDASITTDTDVIWDFRFVNDTDAPIYIQADAGDGQLTFNIYGKEYRPSNRTVEYVSETSDPEEVTTRFIESNSYSLGYMSVSGGISGISADLYKIVYVDGVEESRDLVSTSTYTMMPLTYTIGISDADSETIAAIDAAIKTGEVSAVQQAINSGSTTE